MFSQSIFLGSLLLGHWAPGTQVSSRMEGGTRAEDRLSCVPIVLEGIVLEYS